MRITLQQFRGAMEAFAVHSETWKDKAKSKCAALLPNGEIASVAIYRGLFGEGEVFYGATIDDGGGAKVAAKIRKIAAEATEIPGWLLEHGFEEGEGAAA